ncbi:MAG: putative membrane protein [Verrucomicrobiales bacterium]|jgi:putative membrane protein
MVMVTRVLGQFVRGFAMGASDVVPGVSGGTVALILGIYNGLITNIGTGSKALGRLIRGDFSGFLERLRAVDWLFLIPLLAGIGAAVVVLSGVIERALHDYPEAMAGLFFGLVIGSIVVARGLLQSPAQQHAGIAVVVGAVTFALLGFQSGPISDPSPVHLVVAGALAICAMILPGISGSFILLMTGMYATVLNAVDERIFSEIALVGIGAILGLGLFSSLLTRLLDGHHDIVMATLIGLMLGSLRVLWPWPNGVGIIGSDETISGTGLDLPNGSPWVVPVLLAFGAAIAVLGLSTYAQPGAGEDTQTH